MTTKKTTVASYTRYADTDVRVRVHFANRKMSIPGRVVTRKGAKHPVLSTTWGTDYPLFGEPITSIDVKDLDSGRFVPAAA